MAIQCQRSFFFILSWSSRAGRHGNKGIKLARKWRKLVANSRKRISFPRASVSSTIVEKGHFVVYSSDDKRFALPLKYLNNNIFTELLAMAEEEFGLPGDGPIILPCDAAFMEYAVHLIQKNAAHGLEEALLLTSISCRSLLDISSVHQKQENHLLPAICSF